MAARRAWRLVIVLVAAPAFAGTSTAPFVSGAGAATADSGTARDSFEVDEVSTADDDLHLCAQGTSCQTHNALNGGTTAQQWAWRVVVASGEHAYVTVPAEYEIDATTASACASFHVPSAPSAARKVLATWEDVNDDGTGDQRGCTATLNADLSITLGHSQLGSAVGTTTLTARAAYCVGGTPGGSCVTGPAGDAECASNGLGFCVNGACAAINRPCTTGTESVDCPSAQACGTCNTTTGADCYFLDACVTETVYASNRVECDLRVDGVLVLDGTETTTTGPVGAVVDARWGAIDGAETGSLDMTMTNLRLLPNDSEPGWAHIAELAPASEHGALNTWSDNGGCSADHSVCVGEFGVTDYDFAETVDIRTPSSSRIELFPTLQPQPILPNAAEIPFLQSVWICRTTTGSATRKLQSSLAVDGTALIKGAAFTIPEDTTHKVRDRFTAFEAPIAGDTGWQNALDRAGSQIETTSDNNGNVRCSANLVHAPIVRPGEARPVTFDDRNDGTNDGIRTMCVDWHSGNGGTFGTKCIGGENDEAPCSQAFYCSSVATGDAPAGGCQHNPSMCQACTERRADLGQIGFPCGPNNGGEDCDRGPCSGGFCSGAPSLACTGNEDCDLGTCDTCTNSDCTAETPQGACVESCPGGTCPTDRNSVSSRVALAVGADVHVQLFQGGETSEQWVANRFVNALRGKSRVAGGDISIAESLSGPVGTCECDADADCDSGASGTCTAGLCTSGDTIACGIYADCETLQCQLPPCDLYVNIDRWANNAVTGYGFAPQCEGAASAPAMEPGGPCDKCPDLPCDGDSDCTSRASGASCTIGHHLDTALSSSTETCRRQASFLFGPCTVEIPLCNETADCPLADQTCTGGTPGAPYPTGECQCSASAGACTDDDDCDAGQNCVDTDGNGSEDTCHACPVLGDGTGYACVGSYCRKQCTADAQCGDRSDCRATHPRVCESLCDCPSSSSDMAQYPNADACTTDADCPRTFASAGTSRQGIRAYVGTCDQGTSTCECSGPAMCYDPTVNTDCLPQARAWRRGHATESLRAMQRAKATLRALKAADPEGDGPLLVWAAAPDSLDAECGLGRNDPGLHLQTWAWCEQEFPGRCIDLNGAIEDDGLDACLIDVVHLTPGCAEVVGNEGSVRVPGIGAWARSLNVCATGSGSTRRAQLYCVNFDGTLDEDDDTCTSAADCEAAQSCTVWPCDDDTDCPNAGDDCHVQPVGD